MAEMEKEINKMKKDIAILKKNMIDPDSILTFDDYQAIRSYRAQKKKGTLITQEQLEKELRKC